MKVLIVFAHNEAASFNAAMKDMAAAKLRDNGHEVIVSDLYAMKFKAVADGDDFLVRANPDYLVYAMEQRVAYKNGTLAPDITAELEKVKWADLIIFNFPIYWYSMPAIMKGWIDRVLVSGYCYGGMRFYDRGGLAGKKALVATSLGGQPHMFQPGSIHGELEAMLKPILQGTLAYTGLAVLPPFVAFHVPYIADEQRAGYLNNYAARLDALETTEPLRFPSMDDFDEKLNPKGIAGTPATARG